MASETTTLRWLEQALTIPRATKNDFEAQQLAYALGYPIGWRVFRQIVDDDQIVDRIVAGEEDSADTWFNHAAAANEAIEEREMNNGHLLPKQPKFEPKQEVQVLYENQWYKAKILKRRQQGATFKYQVLYKQDKSRQNNVDESLIKPSEDTPLAIQLGLGPDWEAKKHMNKYTITSPDGTVYHTVAEALSAFQVQDDGDPPWRTKDHEYLGRYVRWTSQYKVSSRRSVDIEQIGRVIGWIAETDVDSAGNPGFVSSKTGEPARLYHVVFDDNPSNHPYPNALIDFQDLEEWELESKMLPPDYVKK